MIKNQTGFTLIEMLIVMGVIAILAVAILSAIDPVEQMRKAEDSRMRSDTAELLNALERYYTTFREYPWSTAPDADCPQFDGSPATCDLPLDDLIDTNELKPQFANRELENYYITQDSNDSVHICFRPQSKSWDMEATTKAYTQTGTTGCTADCYVCVPE